MSSDAASARRVRLGVPLIRLGEVTSTMDIAHQLEARGATEGTTVIASNQTQGRGRSGRQWQSPAGAGLYCSVLLRPQIPIARFQPFSLAAGLVLCDALDPKGDIGLQLKWPNDVLYRDRKLAGILVTSNLLGESVSSAILGIGLNLSPDPTRPPHAIALAELARAPTLEITKFEESVFTSLSHRYRQILHGDPSTALAGWEARLAYLHMEVTIRDGEESIHGLLSGIDDRGSLLLQTPAGLRSIVSGELTRGPRPI